MKFTRRDIDGAVVLDLKGKFEGGPVAEDFRELFKQLVEENRTNVIINLKDVEWIASNGIGILIRCYKSIAEAGGNFALVRVSERTDHVFNVMRLYNIFKSFDNEDEALQYFAQQK